MLNWLPSLPMLIGCCLFMSLTLTIGMLIDYATYRSYHRSQSAAALDEIERANGNLVRVVGWLAVYLAAVAHFYERCRRVGSDRIRC